MSNDVFRELVTAIDAGGRAALVTIVSTSGSTPQRVGARMLVHEDGRTIGTIGGGCYENDACGRAREAIRTGRPALVRYSLTDDVAAESGLICGGQMEVFIDPVVPIPDLYLLGAGHVSVEVARIAQLAGFRVHVVDDREKFANADRFPGAEVVVAQIPDWLNSPSLPADAYVAVVTRGHRHDLDAVRELVGRPTRYLGLIGSRAKVLKVFEVLQGEGVGQASLDAIHAPIGFDIGAVTPAEIAVSIVAELIAVKSGRMKEAHVAQAALRSRLRA